MQQNRLIRFLVVPALCLSLALSLSGCLSSPERQQRKAALTALEDTGSQSYALSSGTTLERQVLFSRDGIELTALGITETDGVPALAVVLLNGSRRDVSMSVRSACVNGWIVDCWSDLYDVSVHGAVFGFLSLDGAVLDAAGITDIAELELSLDFYDADTYDDIGTARVMLETSAAGTYVQADPPSGVVLYDRDGIRVSALALSSGTRETALTLILENGSSRDVSFSSEDAAAHGVSFPLYLSASVPAGRRAVRTESLYDADYHPLTLSGEDVLSFTLELYDSSFHLMDAESVSLSPAQF